MSDKKKKKREGFWGAYINKKDGAIRGYDIKNPSVKIFCIFIMLICATLVVISVFPRTFYGYFWQALRIFVNLREM